MSMQHLWSKSVQIFKHKKRGSIYKIVGRAKLQTTEPIVDMTDMIVYQAEDGTLWCRPYHEFYDGRFEFIGEFK